MALKEKTEDNTKYPNPNNFSNIINIKEINLINLNNTNAGINIPTSYNHINNNNCNKNNNFTIGIGNYNKASILKLIDNKLGCDKNLNIRNNESIHSINVDKVLHTSENLKLKADFLETINNEGEIELEKENKISLNKIINSNPCTDILKYLFEDFIDLSELASVLKSPENKISDENSENSIISYKNDSPNPMEKFESNSFLNEKPNANFFDDVYNKYNNLSIKNASKRKNVCLKLLNILKALVNAFFF